ncbi:MAG: hypothetical protein ACLPND_09545 [Candidatus Korobacteraceae bacterium]
MKGANRSQSNPQGTTRDKGPAAAAAPPRLIIRTCVHIKEDGRRCQAAAVAKRDYCRAHLESRGRLRKMARARRRAAVVKLPPMVDLQAVQAARVRVRVALAAGHIEKDRARVLFSLISQVGSLIREQEGNLLEGED